MISKLSPSPFLKNIVTTSVTSLCITGSLVFVTAFLAKGLGPQDFGAYSMARRFIANIAPLILLSSGVAVRRYVALTDSESGRLSYVISALMISGCTLLILISTGFVLGEELSIIIFSDISYIKLLYACIVYLCCYSLWGITLSYLFGTQKIQNANLFQLFIGSIFPFTIAYLLAPTTPVNQIVLIFGIGHLACLIILLPEIWKAYHELTFERIVGSLMILLRYGLPRVPGDFALAGLFSIGPFLAGYYYGIEMAGFFVVAQYVFRIMEAVITSFGLVALPTIAKLLAQGQREHIKENLENLLIMIFHLGIFLTIHLLFWIREIVLVWLGHDYIDAILIMKILILSVSPYLAYVMLRSVVDAIEVRAINTINLLSALIFSVVLSITLHAIGLKSVGIAIGSASGFCLLGILTWLFLSKRFGFKTCNFYIYRIILLNFLMASLVGLAKHFILYGKSGVVILAWGMGVELLLFILYVFILYIHNVQWIIELKKRIWSR